MDEVGSELASHFVHQLVDIQCVRVDVPTSLCDSALELRVYQRRK